MPPSGYKHATHRPNHVLQRFANRVQVHLEPVQSSFLFASMPVGIALGMFVAERVARVAGRVPTIIAFKATAAGLLTLMALDTRLWAMPAVVVPVYLVRTALANCTRAINRSILMDYVPKVLP